VDSERVDDTAGWLGVRLFTAAYRVLGDRRGQCCPLLSHWCCIAFPPFPFVLVVDTQSLFNLPSDRLLVRFTSSCHANQRMEKRATQLSVGRQAQDPTRDRRENQSSSTSGFWVKPHEAERAARRKQNHARVDSAREETIFVAGNDVWRHISASEISLATNSLVVELRPQNLTPTDSARLFQSAAAALDVCLWSTHHDS